MTGIVIRLAGVEQPETRVFHQQSITIGTSPHCDLSFRDDDFHLPPSAVLMTLQAEDGPYRITELHDEAHVLRDGDAIAIGDAVRDGDTFNFGTTGVRVRFFFLSPDFELAESLQLGTAVLTRSRTESKPKIFRARRQATAPRTDVALVFVKKLLRELVAEIPRRILYASLGIIGLIIGTIIYINVMNFIAARINSDLTKNLNNEVTDIKKQLDQMRDDIKSAQAEAGNAKSALALPTVLVGQYGDGVCLIYGMYSYYDPRSGRETRYKDNSDNPNLIGPNGTLNISVDGTGPPSDLEFIGTGFQIATGKILTNRHVVQPWDDDPVTGVLKNYGLRPRLKELYVYFPKVKQPFVLHTEEVSGIVDVALCSFQPGDTDTKLLPTLPMDESKESTVASGQQMVLLGYPAGLEGLLAKVDDRDRRNLSLNRRSSLKAVLNELASRGLIRPMNTQGHISDLLDRRLVHDAGTADGGSGGPIFGSNGKVIAINQAVLDSSPAKFGVPIRFGLDLVHKQKSDEAISQNTAVPQSSAKP